MSNVFKIFYNIILCKPVYNLWRICYNIYILLFQGVIIIEILKLSVGDTLELKKPHPCGNKLFKVMRVGSDVRIACLECGRDLTLDRIKLEKSIKKIQSEN